MVIWDSCHRKHIQPNRNLKRCWVMFYPNPQLKCGPYADDRGFYSPCLTKPGCCAQMLPRAQSGGKGAAPRRKRGARAWSCPPICNPTEGQRLESHDLSPEAPFSTSGGKQVAAARQIGADRGGFLPSARASSCWFSGSCFVFKTIQVPRACAVTMSPGAWVLCCLWLHTSYPLSGDSFMETGRQRENPLYFAKSKKRKDSGGFKQQQIGHLPVRKKRRNLSPLTQF